MQEYSVLGRIRNVDFFSWFQAKPLLRLSQAFLALFLLTFAFQIRTLVFSEFLYATGNFNIYASFFVHAGDFFIVLAFVFWAWAVLRKKTQRVVSFGDKWIVGLFIAFFSVAFISGIFFHQGLIHFLYLFRGLEFFLLLILLVNRILSFRHAALFFLGGMAFQAFLAVIQYVHQSSLGLRFLGEPIAGIFTPGVAKVDLPFGKVLRAFGTFPHANVLGGAMVFSLFLSLMVFEKRFWWKWGSVGLFGLALLLSFSRSAFLALFLGFFVYMIVQRNPLKFIKNGDSGQALKFLWAGGTAMLLLVVLSVVSGVDHVLIQRIFFDGSAALSERMLYFDISKKMFFAHPFGVGLGGFTKVMQNFTDVELKPWLFQPVHNVFALALNEVGIIGFMLLLMIIGLFLYRLIRSLKMSKGLEKRSYALFLSLFFAGLAMACFDHYFWTLYAGQVMAVCCLGLGMSCTTGITDQRGF